MSEKTNEKERGWLLPPRKKNAAAGLHLVSTPIGNLNDVTLRALDVLSAADIVVCEDTRVTGKLLSHYGLKKKLLPYNDHNADRQRAGILEKLAAGAVVALVSDAGTPLVSDPGFKLVQACIESDIPVTSAPGASAVLTGLQLSGLPADGFFFGGFLPPRQGARKSFLKTLKDVPGTLIFYETAPRLLKALADVQDVLGARDVAVARELTKMFEEVRRFEISEALAFYQNADVKGEIVLIVGPAGESAAVDIEKELKKALKSMSVKDAAALVAKETGVSRKKVYELALRLGK